MLDRLLALAMTIGWTGAVLAAPEPPRHVMSLSQCTDALLLELLPTDRIASISYLSRKRSNSSIWPQAGKVAINYGSAEEVLAERPDLVLAGTYTTPATRALIKQTGTPLIEVPPANNFAEIRSMTRDVARALGTEATAERLIADMDATLQTLDSTRPPRVIRVAAWDGGGAVPGKDSLFDAILSAAGGVNIAASGERDGSFDLEQLLAAAPDVLAFGDSTSTPGPHMDDAFHPLLLKLFAGRRVSYSSALYACGVVESASAAVALRSSLMKALPVSFDDRP